MYGKFRCSWTKSMRTFPGTHFLYNLSFRTLRFLLYIQIYLQSFTTITRSQSIYFKTSKPWSSPQDVSPFCWHLSLWRALLVALIGLTLITVLSLKVGHLSRTRRVLMLIMFRNHLYPTDNLEIDVTIRRRYAFTFLPLNSIMVNFSSYILLQYVQREARQNVLLTRQGRLPSRGSCQLHQHTPLLVMQNSGTLNPWIPTSILHIIANRW